MVTTTLIVYHASGLGPDEVLGFVDDAGLAKLLEPGSDDMPVGASPVRDVDALPVDGGGVAVSWAGRLTHVLPFDAPAWHADKAAEDAVVAALPDAIRAKVAPDFETQASKIERRRETIKAAKGVKP